MTFIEELKKKIEEESYNRCIGTPEELFIEGCNFILPLLEKAIEQRDYWLSHHPDKDYSEIENKELMELLNEKV